MPKRKRELDPELVHRTVRELKEILPRHRVKDPKRVAAGKAAWAKLPQEEKDRRLALLRAGREARTGPARREKKGRRNVFEQSLYEVHKNLVERGYSKKEVKQSIQDWKGQLGLVKKRRKNAPVSDLPQLQNPLPQFFGKFIKQAIKVATVPLKAQLHIIKNTLPIAEAIGIVPPGSSAFTLLRLLFQNV